MSGDHDQAETTDEGETDGGDFGVAIGALSAVAELVTAAGAVFQPWRDELTGNWMRAPAEARASALKILGHCERFVGRAIGGQA